MGSASLHADYRELSDMGERWVPRSLHPPYKRNPKHEFRNPKQVRRPNPLHGRVGMKGGHGGPPLRCPVPLQGWSGYSRPSEEGLAGESDRGHKKRWVALPRGASGLKAHTPTPKRLSKCLISHYRVSVTSTVGAYGHTPLPRQEREAVALGWTVGYNPLVQRDSA